MFEQVTRTTYGGEVEMLAVSRETGSPAPLSFHLQAKVQEAVSTVTDVDGNALSVDYDSAKYLVEIGAGIHDSLPRMISALSRTISILQRTLVRKTRDSLLSSSYHPFEEMQSAYIESVRKPLYDLYRGPFKGELIIHPEVLPKVFPTHPEIGRGWKLEASMLAAATQPWNSLMVEQAADQLAVIQATGWVFNLLTANSPFAYGRLTGKRDSRLEIWEQLMSTSRYSQDRALIRSLPAKPGGLTDYYRYIHSQQRPAIVPHVGKEETADRKYRMKFLAFVQPEDEQELNVLKYLQANSVTAIDIETGEEKEIKPSVAHIFNGFDFLYYPRYGARLRVNLPMADQVDPKLFAQAIINGDEAVFQSLLIQGGILEGSICLEGRIAATVLPTKNNPSWERFSIPFVLQTAILRAHREVWRLLEATPLTWTDLTEVLPDMSNDVKHGFETVIKGIHVTELATQIWTLAQKSLTDEERALVGDEIDMILSRHMAPAEEQIALIEMTLRDGHSMDEALQKLVHHLFMGLETSSKYT